MKLRDELNLGKRRILEAEASFQSLIKDRFPGGNPWRAFGMYSSPTKEQVAQALAYSEHVARLENARQGILRMKQSFEAKRNILRKQRAENRRDTDPLLHRGIWYRLDFYKMAKADRLDRETRARTEALRRADKARIAAEQERIRQRHVDMIARRNATRTANIMVQGGHTTVRTPHLMSRSMLAAIKRRWNKYEALAA
jgi:hypothetical protein